MEPMFQDLPFCCTKKVPKNHNIFFHFCHGGGTHFLVLAQTLIYESAQYFLRKKGVSAKVVHMIMTIIHQTIKLVEKKLNGINWKCQKCQKYPDIDCFCPTHQFQFGFCLKQELPYNTYNLIEHTPKIMLTYFFLTLIIFKNQEK